MTEKQEAFKALLADFNAAKRYYSRGRSSLAKLRESALRAAEFAELEKEGETK